MLITCIELENIKSYRRVRIAFRRGTTAISGVNGSGKTTLVEAIGFALFGYLPYSHEQFVREGEKYGKVVVHLIGGDERPYIVERRCGSGAIWQVTDTEANVRLEQRADVLDKLHELFGIDRERPLDSLFRDALGVPQGTFTSIFLDPASKRKQTFDALLQIEDYKKAAEELLETQRHYKTQIQEQQAGIQRLTYETRELDTWHNFLKEERVLDVQQQGQHVQWSKLLVTYEERAASLTAQFLDLNILEQRYNTCHSNFEHAQERLQEREQQLLAARAAQQIVSTSQYDYQQYQQAQDVVKRLRQDAQKRNALRIQQAKLQNNLATVAAKANSWQQRLQEVGAARQQVVKLAPLVEQQIQLEQQRDEAKQHVTRYESIMAEGKSLKEKLIRNRQEQENLQRKIADIEPLIPIAAQVQQHSDTWTQLRIQASERSSKQQQLREKQALLHKKQNERDQTAESLRNDERNVSIIEEHRAEAEEMPALQAQYEQFSEQKHHLEGIIEGYTKSRIQSVGGQCPFLQESCLNIKQRGVASLELYFENLLIKERVQMTHLNQQQATISERQGQIQKYADRLNKLERYIERRDGHATSLQHSTLEIQSLECDVTNLTQDLEVLELVEQRMQKAECTYNESKLANTKVQELTGMRSRMEQLQEDARQFDADLQERHRDIEGLSGSSDELRHIETALHALDDPRSHSKVQQVILAQEKHFAQQLQNEREQQQSISEKLQVIDAQIALFDTLDVDIAQQEAIIQLSQAGYQNYLKNEQEAHLLVQREQAYQQQKRATEEAARSLREAEQAYFTARDAFKQEALDTLNVEVGRIRHDLVALTEKMEHQRYVIKELEQKIAHAETLLVELQGAQKEQQELNDLHTMVEQFRKIIKDAAPHVLKAMLGDISAEANRIFGEVMGDRSAQLSWRNDYEIVLRRQSVQRTFAQLSGGEQMSAALSVRLALLKKLSTLNIAFFDEPTQNMDEMRRMNLAEQIRRVRGFDQLIVISHDDTFEQGLDSLVRLSKIDGETRVQDEDAMVSTLDEMRAMV